MSICVEVWGDYACFTRPEMKTERVSYDVMTPSAARGLIEAIYWHPGIRWVIDRVYVRAPIRFTSVRRNEVEKVISHSKAYSAMCGKRVSQLFLNARDTENRAQRATLLLRDVRYVIQAHFNITQRAAPGDNAGEFQDIIKRRLDRGQFYHQPYFGCREFPAHFAPCREVPPCPEELKGERDLGWMLYDMSWEDFDADPRPLEERELHPRFFRAVLRDGVLKVPPPHSEEVRG